MKQNKLNKLKSKKLLIPVLGILVVLAITLVIAIQLNWFEIGDLSGTIKKNEMTITPAHLNLGSIASGSSFVSTDTATLNIPVTESNGMNVSKFLLVVHVSGIGDSRDYLLERFSTLYLNVTMMGLTTIMKVVANNEALQSEYLGDGVYSGWSYEDSEYSPDRAWWSSYDWVNTFLSTGSHTIEITAYGKSSAPSVDLAINLAFSLELIT